MKIKRVLMGIMTFLLNSCAMYEEHFDCPPPRGVPCTSVTDLEASIVETDQGPDFLLPNEKEELTKKCKSRRRRSCSKNEPELTNRRIWICNPDDGASKGHYLDQGGSTEAENE